MPSPLQEIGAYLENEINRLGYAHLQSGEVDSGIAVFQYNAESFPKSPNGYDSLGEAWLAKGDTAQAVRYYKRALELNPAFVNAANVLEHLREFGWH